MYKRQYQLPAVALGGTTLVVSPLIALMKDQVDQLTARGIPAGAIYGAQTGGEREDLLERFQRGELRLLYVAPERFRSARFDDLLAAAPPLTLIAIDEAHCISEWGHDFRPDYRRLGEAVAKLKPARLVALTATATPEVRRDIGAHLGMEDPAVFVRGFDRPNLRFAVERVSGKDAKLERLASMIRGFGAGSALVYAATRKNAEAHADALARMNIAAAAYHAGLPDAKRADVQDRFMRGKLRVVVATNAFGMGVDKSDVRLVIHADLPRSAEAYYQEAGRGGRDGDPAECVMLFQHADVRTQEFLIDASYPSAELLRALWKAVREEPRLGSQPGRLRDLMPGKPSEFQISSASRLLEKCGFFREDDGIWEAVKPEPGTAPPLDADALSARAEVERSKLRSMVEYCYSTGCRRRWLLAYFGDADADGMTDCGGCDVCLGSNRRELPDDEARLVRAALGLIGSLRGRFGRTKVSAMLTGSDDDERMSEAPGRGCLAKKGPRYAMDLLRSLEGAGLIVTSPGEYPTITLTTAGKRAADGGAALELALPEDKAPRGRKERATRARSGRPQIESDEPIDGAMVDRLRTWRGGEARRLALPAYMIVSNAVIDAIARAAPRDLVALGVLPGIGPAKLDKYGAAILAVVAGGSGSAVGAPAEEEAVIG